jgi:hypothetical protein
VITRTEFEIDLRPSQQHIAPAQAGDDGEAAQLGKIDVLNLVESTFLAGGNFANVAALFREEMV